MSMQMSPLWGEIAALSAAFLWSISSTLFTTVGKRIGPLNLNAMRIALSAILFTFSHFVLFGTFLPSVNSMQLLILSISGIIGLAVGDLAYFGSLIEIGPRRAVLVSSMAPIFSLIGGYFMLGEMPSLMAMVGIFLVLFGIWIVIVEKMEEEDRRSLGINNVLKGVLFGTIGAAGQGIGVVFSKYGMLFSGSSLDPLSTTVIRVLAAAPVIWLTVLLWKKPRYVVRAFKDKLALKLVVIGSIIGPFVGLWFSMISIKYVDVGIASTLMSMTPIMIIPVVYIAHREKVNIRGIIGAIVSVIGVALIFLF